MCGIACILDIQTDAKPLRERAVAMARLLRHRGPDWSGVFADRRAILAHERLSIVDVLHGAQPLTNQAEDIVLAVNGEIYNHKALRTELEHTSSPAWSKPSTSSPASLPIRQKSKSSPPLPSTSAHSSSSRAASLTS